MVKKNSEELSTKRKAEDICTVHTGILTQDELERVGPALNTSTVTIISLASLTQLL